MSVRPAAARQVGQPRQVHVVLPNDIDDPATPSGGNVYDRRICAGLVAAGWIVHEHAVRGGWPEPTDGDRDTLGRLLDGLPDRAVVLLDGLVASGVPEILRPRAARLRLVVVVHLPLGGDRERAALDSAMALIATSEWTRRWLIERHGLPARSVRVAAPGVDRAEMGTERDDGGRLLCVAAVIPRKGHDVLADALGLIADLDWTCVCAGALDLDIEFTEVLAGRLAAWGLTGRVRLAGPLTGHDLAAAYGAADLLVLPSRDEPFGMVATEALARGVPVLASAVGGLPEALGGLPDGLPDVLPGGQPGGQPGGTSGQGQPSTGRPGLLVPPGDPVPLAAALRRWLTEPDLRKRLRDLALARRDQLADWAVPTAVVSGVLAEVSA